MGRLGFPNGSLQLAQRVLAWSHQDAHPGIAARQNAARQCGHESSPDDRGLAAARRADYSEQRRSHEPGNQFRDEPLATEVVVGVALVERRKPLERADNRTVALLGEREALAGRLQIDDASGKLSLHRAQLGPAGGGAACHLFHALGGLAPRPLAGEFVHATRKAFAGLAQPLDRNGAVCLRRVRKCDLLDSLGVEGLEGDVLVRTKSREYLVVLARRDHEHRDGSECAPKVAQPGKYLGAREIGGVDDDERRPGRLSRPIEDFQGLARRAATGRVEDVAGTRWISPASSAASRLLPIPGGPLRVIRAPAPASTLSQRSRSRASSRPDPPTPAPPPGRARAGARRRGPECKRVVLAQDRVLELAQLGPGLYADVFDEPPARVLESLQRLGLPTAAVESEHELTGELLAGRVVGDQLPQLAHQIGVPACLEVGGDASLERGESLLVEARNIRLRERLEGQVGQRSAAPEGEGVAQECGCPLGIAGGEASGVPPPHLPRSGRRRARRAARAAHSHLSQWPGSPGRRAPCGLERR